jgi:PHD/YefM family antitoxin component YafN of YafNO toxin-antitoxin module
MRQVPVTEFARNFRRYREIAQREPVAVTRRGRAAGYFVSPIDPKRSFTGYGGGGTFS